MAGPRRRADGGSLRAVRLLVDLLLLVVVAIGLGGVVLGRVLPALGSPVLVVAGPSMSPAVPVGAAVVLEPVDPAELAVGDVVSLKSGPARAIFTHRIVRLVPRDDGLWLETKGDANDQPDPSITPASAVIGRVTVALPGAGFALTVLSTPAGVVFILATGVLLITLGWALDDAAHDRRRRAALAAGGVSAPEAPPRTFLAGAVLVPSRIGLVGVVPAAIGSSGAGSAAAQVAASPSGGTRHAAARPSATARRPPAKPNGRSGTGARTGRRGKPA